MRFSNSYENVICICGSGRNVGKTLLGESIITTFSKEQDIVSIKISKFKQSNHKTNCLKVLRRTLHYTVWQELSFSSKDSGRYLKAGAKLSIYIECEDAFLLDAFLYVKNNFCQSCLIVCESASIIKYINPAVVIFVRLFDQPIAKNKLRCYKQSNLILNSKCIEISLPRLFLSSNNNKWVVEYSKKMICHV